MQPVRLVNGVPTIGNEPVIVSRPDVMEPFAGWLHRIFCNDKTTPMFQVITAFAFGVILSPWSSGLFFLVIFIIIYEIFLYIFTHGDERYWDSFTRCGVICASLLGFIVGRTLSGDEILVPGVPGEE
jgi:hypothetical protein